MRSVVHALAGGPALAGLAFLTILGAGQHAPAATELFNDTWAYHVDTQTWEQLHPAGTPPSADYGYRAYYDAENQRMLTNADGGMALSLVPGEEEWTPLEPPEGHIYGTHHDTTSNTLYRAISATLHYWNLTTGESGTMPVSNWQWTGMVGSRAVDEARTRLVDFGQQRLVTYDIGETETTAALLPLIGDVPPTYDFHGAEIDPVRDRMIIFGGNIGEHAIHPNYEGSTFELDLDTLSWIQAEPDASPSPRGQYASVWDPQERRMYILCGLYRTTFDYDSISTYNDVWVYDSATQSWREEITTGPRPVIRRMPAAVFDESNRRIILFAGQMVNGPPPARAVIRNPQHRRRIGGNSVTVMAELTHGTPEGTLSVRFQYRQPSLEGTWTDIPPANPNHPNPDTTHPYFIHWDVTPLTEGPVDIRAVAAATGNVIDPGPEFITVYIDHEEAATVEELTTEGAILLAHRTRSGFGDIATAEPDSTTSANVRIRYDVGAMPDGGVLNVSFTGTDEFAGLPAEQAGIAVHVSMQDGGKNAGGLFTVIMSYPDADHDGVVDGTAIPDGDLTIYGSDGAGGTFELDNVVVNTEARTVRGDATATGYFALAAKGESQPTSVEGWMLY